AGWYPVAGGYSSSARGEAMAGLVRFLLGFVVHPKRFSEARDVMTNSELRPDIHSIEPIPDADRDSTGLQQMWIWAGANLAPVNWALGALGIILKLGLWE